MKTLARKTQDQAPFLLPNTWSQTVTDLLHQIYQPQIESERQIFEVYGALFSDEVLLIASLITPEDELSAPVSLFLSTNLDEESNGEKKMAILVDKISQFFDLYYENEKQQTESLYQAKWESHQERGVEFFYKITRENIRLTLAANRLLGDDF